jgi:AAA domain/Bifunctional DNA primase/polymerase, N-terminal
MTAEECAEMALTPLRLRLRSNGYPPVPAYQKRILLREWTTKADASEDEVANWERDHPDWTNTGVLTATVPTIDVDVRHAEAADRVEDLIIDMFSDHGVLIRRFGEAPKRCIFFRTDEPFPRFRVLVHPNCKDSTGNLLKQRIEVLGRGQQVIVAGLHPETKRPYTYHGGHSPLNVPRSDLPPITRDEAQAFVDLAVETLVKEFGFREAEPDDATVLPWPVGPLDAELALAAMKSGADVNDVQPRIICQKLREVWDPDEIVDFVVNATMAMAAKHSLKQQNGHPWSRHIEVAWVRKRVLSAIGNVFLKDYDHRSGEIPNWLHPKYHDRWSETLKEGRRPCCSFNASGFFVRALRYDHHSLNGNGAGHDNADQDDTEPEADDAREAKQEPNGKRETQFKIQAKPFVPFDPAALPKRQWIYGKHYLLGTASATIGPGGGGKPSLSLVEIIALAGGRNLLGETPVRRCRCWYHNAEDDMDELRRRIAANCQHYHISQDDLAGWLHVTSGVEMPIKIATVANGRGGAQGIIDKSMTEAIIREIVEYQIDVAVFDPLIAHHVGGEGATGDMDQIAREFVRIAYVTNSSVEIVHHTRKPASGQEEMTIFDSRGPIALIDAVRASRVLNTMSSSEAVKARIDDVDRRLHFRMDDSKGNRAKPTAAKWYKFASVPLPNGDDVGVVTDWQYSTSVEDIPDAVCFQIQNEVLATPGQYRAAKQSPNWIGNLIARIFRIDRNEKQGTARIGAILRILYEKGVITATASDAKKHGVEIVTVGSWVTGK